MSGTSTPKNSVGNTLKLYLFPSLVSILAMMIWRDVSELRADVKQLLAQSNIDKTEILNLKREVFKLPPAPVSMNETKHSASTIIAYYDRYFKPEEAFDISKYIPKS